MLLTRLNTRISRLTTFLRHVMYNLRGGFLVRPVIIALTLGLLGLIFSVIEETSPIFTSWGDNSYFPANSDPQLAQVILGSIATSMMTIVSIVFAILLMMLTLASMQFSPRILVSFARDRVTQQTLGIFLGTFTYCLAALPAARFVPHPFAPVLTVLGAMLLALACVLWLLFFIHHISQAISVNHILDRVARETEAMIDELMPQPRRITLLSADPPIESRPDEGVILNKVSGYIRFIDTKKLVSMAKDYHVTVRLLRRIGHFVPAEVPLLVISTQKVLSPDLCAEFRSAIDIGPIRTLQQDVEFGILQIVDIALKAISPAVNDPSTGIACVDQLSSILIKFASREPLESFFYDPPGKVRVIIPWRKFDQLVESAFEQIHLYSKGDLAVSLRILRALTDIASTIEEQATCQLLVERARKITARCAQHLGNEEMKQLQNRLAKLEKTVIKDAI